MSLRPRARALAAAPAPAPSRSRLHQVLSVGVANGGETGSDDSSSYDEQEYEERDWRRNPPDRGYQSGVSRLIEVEEKELVRLQRELHRAERARERCAAELESTKAKLNQRIKDGDAADERIRDLEEQLSVSEMHNQRAQATVERLQLAVAQAEVKLAKCNERCAED